MIVKMNFNDFVDEKKLYKKSNDTVKIGGRFSKDLSLFYTEEDVRNLFNWEKPLY